MRILVSCLQSDKRHPIPAYQFWRRYFFRGLEEAGHDAADVPGVDWAEGLLHPQGPALDRWRARTWGTVLSFVRRAHDREPIRLFLGYLYPQQVDVPAVHELQR